MYDGTMHAGSRVVPPRLRITTRLGSAASMLRDTAAACFTPGEGGVDSADSKGNGGEGTREGDELREKP